jgi:hypothetical protein
VQGAGNTVSNNVRMDLNGLNGILVTGSGNTLSGNQSESGKGNNGNGLQVTGNNNQLTSNKMYTNKGDGFNVFGTGNKLKTNLASSNTGFEFNIGAGNVDQTGNKANGVYCVFGSGAKTCN